MQAGLQRLLPSLVPVREATYRLSTAPCRPTHRQEECGGGLRSKLLAGAAGSGSRRVQRVQGAHQPRVKLAAPRRLLQGDQVAEGAAAAR